MPPVLRRFLLVAAASLPLGCSGSTGITETRDPGALTILALAQNSPPVFDPEVSFYAVRGDGREGAIYFQDAGGGQGEEFLRLKLDQASLLRRPDGSLIAAGDSVLITIRVVDATRILFELEPSGLAFDPLHPAELKLEYDHADGDFNRDGTIDSEDDAIEAELAIWRQAVLNGPFTRLGSVRIEDAREIEADLTSFSRYAIAY